MATDSHVFEGTCCTCDKPARFVADTDWFRDALRCEHCQSIPRERALIYVVETLYPRWREFAIHESSPAHRGASVKLATAPGYVASQLHADLPLGAKTPHGWLNQDLERLTFDDESFDLVITQDVLEHVFDLRAVCREVARTLRPGGAHIFTAPLVNKGARSEERARREPDGSVTHLAEPEYHGNPTDPRGSLVTWHYGYDLPALIQEASGLPTLIFHLDRIDLGIRAEYIEVMATVKPPRAPHSA